MRLIVQACILGLLTGGVYALMASGLTLAFGIMRVINVAQGAMIILGAYLSYTAFSVFHIDPFLSILLLTPLVFALGVTVQLAFIRLLRSDEREELSLLVTWAVALAIEGTLSIFYRTNYRSTITTYANTSWRMAATTCPRSACSRSDLDGDARILYLILSRTRFGRAIRATVQNPVSAALLGIDGRQIAALGFGLSVATAAAAGAVYGMIFPFNPGATTT